MTRKQAITEAKKRWGIRGIAGKLKRKVNGKTYAVGESILWGWTFHGVGNSYETAFADADKRKSDRK